MSLSLCFVYSHFCLGTLSIPKSLFYFILHLSFPTSLWSSVTPVWVLQTQWATQTLWDGVLPRPFGGPTLGGGEAGIRAIIKNILLWPALPSSSSLQVVKILTHNHTVAHATVVWLVVFITVRNMRIIGMHDHKHTQRHSHIIAIITGMVNSPLINTLLVTVIMLSKLCVLHFSILPLGNRSYSTYAVFIDSRGRFTTQNT